MVNPSDSLPHDASQGATPRKATLSSSVLNEDDDEPPIPNSRPLESGPSSLDHHVVDVRDTPEDTALGDRTATMASRDPEKAADADVQERVRRRIAASKTPMGKLKLLFVAEQLGPPLPPPTYKQSLMAVIRYSPLNFCLVFIPVGWALAFTNQNPTVVFAFSALGMIPLAALLGLGTEQVALRTSSSVGALLNMSLGNLVEMIISGIALRRCELEIVQSALIGGLLSNLLLVLGTAFMVGGLRFESQEFHPRVAQLNSSLMVVAVIAFIVPAAFNEVIGERLPQGSELAIILQLSRGSAVILIVIYLAFLVFQFYSHNHLFLDTITNTSYSSSSSEASGVRRSSLTSHLSPRSILSRIRHPIHPPITSSPADRDPEAHSISTTSVNSDDSDDIERPKMNTYSALILLAAVTALAYLTGEHLVDSLTEFTETASISKEWVTLIILPIVSNAAEHTTALIVASKGKFDLAMNVAVGSCIQIALFVYPILVFVAWGMGKPLTMLFDQLETIVLFLSVILVKFSVEDGKSHWLTGTILVCVYVLIALSFWNFPDTSRLVQEVPILCT